MIPEHSYDAERDRLPLLSLLAEIPAYPVLIFQNGPLIRNFFVREFYGKFRGSILGVFWVLVHPIALFATFYLVFGLLFDMRAAEGKPPGWYTYYLFTGVLAWTVFSDTSLRCTTVVLDNSNLIKKVAFPAQLLPIHLALVNLIVYLVGILAYLLVALIGGFELPGARILFLPLVLFVQLVFSIGIGLFLSAANVFFRDVSQVFPIILNLWFFATPVFWHDKMFAGRPAFESLTPFMKLNPMLHILGAHRSVLGTHLDSTASVLSQCGIAFVPAFLTFVFGFVLFRSLQHRFADEV
ncbi:MAG: ABC transporter permease [Planctomycetota bacterium]